MVSGKKAVLVANTVNITEEISDSHSARPNPDQLKEVFANLVQVLKDQGLSQQDMLDIYQGPSVSPDMKAMPVAIFATKLSPSESLCKYLKENLKLSYKEIASILNRDERSIWTSHNRSKEKMSGPFSSETLKPSNMVPIQIFSNRKMSILENLVLYLRENTDDTNYKIAKLLNKTPSMIYTIYNRARAKMKSIQRPVQQSVQVMPDRPIARPMKKKAKKKRLRLRDMLR